MELIKLKKTFDGEKELIYKQKLDEIVRFLDIGKTSF
jgi:hypothetical protein